MSAVTPNARTELIKQTLRTGGSLTGRRTYPHPFKYSLRDASDVEVDELTEAQMVQHVEVGLVRFKPKSPGDYDTLTAQLV